MTGEIHLNDGDTLTEVQMAKHAYRTHTCDYVDVGMNIIADHQANTVDVGEGYAVVAHESEPMAFPTSVDAVSGRDLPVSAGVNYVYLIVDLNAGDGSGVSVNIYDSDTVPSGDIPTLGGALKIGEVDTSADTKTHLNRGNTYQLDELSGQLTNDQLVTSLLGANLSVVNNALTADIDGGDAETLDGLDSTDFVQTSASIDADTLDGNDSSYFAQSDSPNLSAPVDITGASNHLLLKDTDAPSHYWIVDHNDSKFRVIHKDDANNIFTDQFLIDYTENLLTYIGDAMLNGDSRTMNVGDSSSIGPHKVLFGNTRDQDRGGVMFRTTEDEVTIENNATGEKIAQFPIDGVTAPKVLGNEIRTLQDGNEQPNITVGPNPPSNPDEDDVWIDTGS